MDTHTFKHTAAPPPHTHPTPQTTLVFFRVTRCVRLMQPQPFFVGRLGHRRQGCFGNDLAFTRLVRIMPFRTVSPWSRKRNIAQHPTPQTTRKTIVPPTPHFAITADGKRGIRTARHPNKRWHIVLLVVCSRCLRLRGTCAPPKP